jgi:hypothetical protein
MLRCGPPKRPLVQSAAFCGLKRGSVRPKHHFAALQKRTRTLAGFLTRPMFMRIITGHRLARRCFEPVVGAGPTWTRVPESVKQSAFAGVIHGARPAFPIGGRARLFRAQMSQACAIRHGPFIRPTLLAFTNGTLVAYPAFRPRRAAQVRASQVRASQVRVAQVRVAQVRVAQVRVG